MGSLTIVDYDDSVRWYAEHSCLATNDWIDGLTTISAKRNANTIVSYSN